MDAAERLAEVARTLGDPARAKMLWSLIDGQTRPAGELALIANVSSQNASNHLAQLRSAGLVSIHIRGRSHFYKLRDESVARTLESLMCAASLTPARSPEGSLARSAPELALARTCYDHLAGAVAVRIRACCTNRSWLEQDSTELVLTASGRQHMGRLGIDLSVPAGSRRRFAFPCLDWSERVHHIGGFFGASILDWLLTGKAVVRRPDSRALRITDRGRAILGECFEIQFDVQGRILAS
jgi:DNA-binding transcriptional ArsR family regulator